MFISAFLKSLDFYQEKRPPVRNISNKNKCINSVYRKYIHMRATQLRKIKKVEQKIGSEDRDKQMILNFILS